MADRNLIALHSTYHGNWWLGYITSQGISRLPTDLTLQKYPASAPDVLIILSISYLERGSNVMLGDAFVSNVVSASISIAFNPSFHRILRFQHVKFVVVFPRMINKNAFIPQITPASSEWEQSSIAQPAKSQSTKRDSEPLKTQNTTLYSLIRNVFLIQEKSTGQITMQWTSNATIYITAHQNWLQGYILFRNIQFGFSHFSFLVASLFQCYFSCNRQMCQLMMHAGAQPWCVLGKVFLNDNTVCQRKFIILREQLHIHTHCIPYSG